MAVLLKQDAVFLHIPKTGGTWVVEVLAALGLLRCKFSTKHSDMQRTLHTARYYPLRWLETAALRGPLWQRRVVRAYKFCFVRHPLRWYESYWKFSVQREWQRWGIKRGRQRWHPNGPLNELADADFIRFMRKVAKRQPGNVSRMFSWYATSDCDFVGRQETLSDDLIRVLKDIGATFDEDRVRHWPRANETTKSIADPEWDEELRETVERQEEEALVRYGYVS